MHWIILALAGVFEITWSCAMKASNGFTVLVPTIVTVVGSIASSVFLALALKHIPLGTAYSIWTGMGIVGSSTLGVVLFHDKLSGPQIACVCMIALGIVGLKLLATE